MPAVEPSVSQAPDMAYLERGGSPLLRPEAIVQLQRSIGNRAVHALLQAARIPQPEQQRVPDNLAIQRKPADINGTHELKYDINANKKKHINAKAPRATGLTRTKVINAQAKDGWVTPSDQLIGGHLFAAEFGGPDDDTNVVPWRPEREEAFGNFEDDFQKQAMKDARAAPDKKLTLTVKTAATFADRDDLKVGEGDLTSAGWGDTQSGRAERKQKFEDVSERFSGIPTSVQVKLTGLSTGERTFAPAPVDLAPHYLRNDDAIKPGFVPYKRYQRNATEPRALNVFNDWHLSRHQVLANKLVQKLGHVAGRHGDHFGVEKNNEPDNVKQLQVELKTLVDTTTNEQILGTYMGKDVIHYVNAGTKQWLCVVPSGDLLAAFKLSTTQYDTLIAEGKVG
jgi:hypothetical protein